MSVPLFLCPYAWYRSSIQSTIRSVGITLGNYRFTVTSGQSKGCFKSETSEFALVNKNTAKTKKCSVYSRLKDLV